MEKVCVVCGRSLPETEFYSVGSGKGLDTNCKDCRKAKIRKYWVEKTKNEEAVQKERERGREKYQRLNYKEKKTEKKRLKENKYTSLRNARRDFSSSVSDNIELHHWNYNISDEVIALNRRLHHRLHTSISFNLDEGIYYYGTEKLDTLEKHMNVIKEVCDSNGFDFSEIKVLKK